jgi:hypothetical protein
MKIISGAFNSFLSIFLLLTLASCAEFPKNRSKTLSESQEVLDLIWECKADAIAGSRTRYRVNITVEGSGDLTGDLEVPYAYLDIPGVPAGHCKDIAKEAVDIVKGHEECATRGYTFFASNLSTTFPATCRGKREGLIRIMGQLMRHAHTFVIITP